MTKEMIKLNQKLVNHVSSLARNHYQMGSLEMESRLIELTTLVLAQVDQLIEERLQAHFLASHNSVKNENQE